MLNLLILEWKKFRKFTVFRVLALLYLLLLPAVFFLSKALPKPPEELISFKSFLMFPNIWTYLGYVGNWLVFFLLGFIGVLSITSEYTNKTLRQNIITGLTRKQFFLSKLSLILVVSFGATLYYTLCCGIIGFFHTDTIYMSKVLQNIDYIPRYFLMCMGYMTFALLVGLLLKRTGFALFLYLLYIMVLESMIRYGIHGKFFNNKSMHFYPMNSVEDLAPIPFAKQAGSLLEGNNTSLLLSPMEASITAAIYIILMLAICYYLLTKRDL